MKQAETAAQQAFSNSTRLMVGAALALSMAFSTGAYWDSDREAAERADAISENRGLVGIGSASIVPANAKLAAARSSVQSARLAALGVSASLRQRLGDARADDLLHAHEELARASAAATASTSVTSAIVGFQETVDQARAEISEWDRKEAERIAQEEAAAAAAIAAAAETASSEWGDDPGWVTNDDPAHPDGDHDGVNAQTHEEYLRLKADFARRVQEKIDALPPDDGLIHSPGCSNGAPRQ
ncbi:hypothetical protein ACFVAJ_16790 [Agromyces sp. NPDC057679]|uniref:hypothetical protein n=1 Tax=Agromyces sp. NPDC057679 TaxID=3346207 RepID=UPI003671C0C4